MPIILQKKRHSSSARNTPFTHENQQVCIFATQSNHYAIIQVE